MPHVPLRASSSANALPTAIYETRRVCGRGAQSARNRDLGDHSSACFSRGRTVCRSWRTVRRRDARPHIGGGVGWLVGDARPLVEGRRDHALAYGARHDLRMATPHSSSSGKRKRWIVEGRRDHVSREARPTARPPHLRARHRVSHEPAVRIHERRARERPAQQRADARDRVVRVGVGVGVGGIGCVVDRLVVHGGGLGGRVVLGGRTPLVRARAPRVGRHTLGDDLVA